MIKSTLPAGAVTGIGSLPLASSESAIQAVAEFSPEIPFWPQLPKLSERESAVAQGLGLLEPRNEAYGYRVKDGRLDSVIATLHHSDGQMVPAHASGFAAFERATFPSAVAVKGQIEGPITLAAYLFHKDRPFLSDPALFAAIAFHVSQTICWQVQRLNAFGLPVLLFIDEPGLGLVSDEKTLSALAVTLDDARSRGAVAGLHCCAARPFERMFRARPDILSFDAYEGLELFFADPQATRFVREGGTVAYGLVPTWQRLESVNAATLFTRWLTAASLAGDAQELAQHSMITATCGLGLLEPSAIAESFQTAHGVGELIRSLVV